MLFKFLNQLMPKQRKSILYFVTFWVLLFSCSKRIDAQTEMPFYGSSFAVLQDTFKTDTLGVYFHYVHDSFNIVFVSHFEAGSLKPRIYKLYDFKERLRVWGEISTILVNGSDFVKDGKWMEFYPDGILKSVGFYSQDEPVAYWEYYYPNGVKRLVYNFGEIEYDESVYIIPIGPYEEFYANGQAKVIGKFKAMLDDVEEEIVDPYSQQTELMEHRRPIPIKAGVWYFYDYLGNEVKKEFFDPSKR